MSHIKDYICTDDMSGLVSHVLNLDYTAKDRQDVFKYLKRNNKIDHISFNLLVRLSIASGDFSSIEKIYEYEQNNKPYDKEIANAKYSALIDFCDDDQLYEKFPDLFYLDSSFLNLFQSLRGKVDSNFIQNVVDNCDNFLNQFTKNIDNSNSKTFCNIFIDFAMRSDMESFDRFFQACMKSSFISKHFGMCISTKIIHYTKSMSLNSLKINSAVKNLLPYKLLPEITIKSFFENSCRFADKPEALEAIELILKSGYKKITSGFNIAVSHWKYDAVKLMLPYKPRLETALTMQKTPEIHELLIKYVESLPKKPKKKLLPDQSADQFADQFADD